MTNTLLHGDCFTLMPDLPDESIDFICADPPYAITSRNEWDVKIDLPLMFSEFNRLIKPDGAMVVFGAGAFIADLITANRKYYRYDLIWQKTNPVGFLNCNRMPMRSHENLLVFYKRLPTYNPQKTPGKPYSCKRGTNTTNYGHINDEHIRTYDPKGERFPQSVLKFSRDQRAGHPTAKPVALLTWLVRTFTDEGQTVLDPFAGGFSTGVACKNCNRSFIGIEKDDTYYAAGVKLLAAP